MKERVRFIIRVRELRKAKGMSQAELAAKAGTTQNTISSIETGQYAPSAYLSGLIELHISPIRMPGIATAGNTKCRIGTENGRSSSRWKTGKWMSAPKTRSIAPM